MPLADQNRDFRPAVTMKVVKRPSRFVPDLGSRANATNVAAVKCTEFCFMTSERAAGRS